MMFFINNKFMHAVLRKLVKQTLDDARRAEHIAITMNIEGRSYTYQADWMKHIQIPPHEHEVQKKIDEQQRKENPNA